MEPLLALRDSVDGLNFFLDAYTSDLSPVLLTQPPSHRSSRREVLWEAVESLDQLWITFQETFAQLCNARDKLCRLRSMTHSALSPISAVPHEILAKIFSFVCSEVSCDEKMALVCGISSICREWRNIAVAHKALWSSASIGGVDKLNKLASQLERCRAGYFDLYICSEQSAELKE